MYITWKEFKDAVDKALKEQGADENMEINYIDFGGATKEDFETGNSGVFVDKEDGLFSVS